MDWLFENLDKVGVIIVAMDTMFGALPDRITRWPGILIGVCHKLYQYGKEQPE